MEAPVNYLHGQACLHQPALSVPPQQLDSRQQLQVSDLILDAGQPLSASAPRVRSWWI